MSGWFEEEKGTSTSPEADVASQVRVQLQPQAPFVQDAEHVPVQSRLAKRPRPNVTSP
jgi:hypothetical protein